MKYLTNFRYVHTNIFLDIDCRTWPESCDTNAECVDTGVEFRGALTYSCQCKNGYLGNGIICFSEPDCIDTCDTVVLAILRDFCNCSKTSIPTTTMPGKIKAITIIKHK